MTFVGQINVKYVFLKNYQAHKLFKTYCIILVAVIVDASLWLTIFSCLATITEASPG